MKIKDWNIRLILFSTLLIGALPRLSAQASDSTHVSAWVKQQQLNKKGMLVLGSWATGNILTSAFMLPQRSGSYHRFYQMNMYWNFVNLALAVPGYFGARKKLQQYRKNTLFVSPDDYRKSQRKTEKLFLINSGLDVLYMGAGILMMQQSNKNPSNFDLVNGYGKSILLQGGFLFTFDLAMFLFHRNNRLKH